MTDSTVAGDSADLREAFPAVDPGAKPLGARVLVQLRRTKDKATSAGIILVQETKETEKWNNMVAKVVEIGPLAFKKRDTMEPWPEGSWCDVGDYLRVPKWGGDRWEVPVPNEEEPALFMILNDHEIIAKVTGNPLAVKAFV
uniref:Co-chaperonin GroES n=1 Tax=uncultured virus TaxID=340016 RepID=A0A221S2Z9_9VIRU|nr:co-chaperonin GroES [uncultured virus]